MSSQTYKVFHHNKGNFTGDIGQTKNFEANYTLVASVIADSLDDVFRLTNHIDIPWWENENVDCYVRYPRFRSTSVGDVIQDMTTKYMCCMIGWQEL